MNSLVETQVQPEWRKPLTIALAVNFCWINLSEVFRYFVFIMPMMRDALPMISDVAPMNLPVFMIWGIWDTILVAAATLIPWLTMNVIGATPKNALLAGTGVWLTVFVVFWLGTYNMNLTTLEIVLTALPFAWFELIVAALIVWWLCYRSDRDTA